MKAKIRKRLHQTKKLLQSQENNQQNQETAHRMKENICELHM